MDESLTKRQFIEECRRISTLFKNAEWTATEDQTDDDHVLDFEVVLNETRMFDPSLPELSGMQFVRDSETGQTLAITGNTVDAQERARAITAVMRALPTVLDELERLDARVIELLESNNEKLFEVRSLRGQIKDLQSRQSKLLELVTSDVN